MCAGSFLPLQYLYLSNAVIEKIEDRHRIKIICFTYFIFIRKYNYREDVLSSLFHYGDIQIVLAWLSGHSGTTTFVIMLKGLVHEIEFKYFLRKE